MIGENKMKAFVPTIRPKEAKKFYRDILDLTFIGEDEYAIEFNAGGTVLRVIVVPALQVQQFTVLGWNVLDIKNEILSLNKKGVFFEKYPFLEQDELGIWTAPNGSKVAWFKDPDGNILSLTAAE
jgi:predicted enzyme related to lactoylglutathione lyase